MNIILTYFISYTYLSTRTHIYDNIGILYALLCSDVKTTILFN